jgi:hypothetical protein
LPTPDMPMMVTAWAGNLRNSEADLKRMGVD